MARPSHRRKVNKLVMSQIQCSQPNPLLHFLVESDFPSTGWIKLNTHYVHFMLT